MKKNENNADIHHVNENAEATAKIDAGGEARKKRDVGAFFRDHKKALLIGCGGVLTAAVVATGVGLALRSDNQTGKPEAPTTLQAEVTAPSEASVTAGSASISASQKPGAPKPSENSTENSGSKTPTENSGSEQSKPASSQDSNGKTNSNDKNTGKNPSNSNGNQKPENANNTSAKPAHEHSYKAVSTVAATCTNGGYTVYECNCGASYHGGETSALGHSYESKVVEATTEAGGYTVHTCTRCGDSYTDSYTEKVEKQYDLSVDFDALIAAGNAYALSIGFGGIDYSLNLDNAGYFPADMIDKEYVEECVTVYRDGDSVQELLLRSMYRIVDSTKDMLQGRFTAYGEGDEISDCVIMAFAAYDEPSGCYKINLLYS